MPFSIFWQPEDPTLNNSNPGGAVASGLMYNLIHNQVRNYQLMVFNVTTGLFVATLAWPGYVSGFKISGKVGGVWMAALELVNSAAPSLP